jgi:hypothetical protein
MFNRLNQHLQCNKTVAPEQFGFRIRTNTDNAEFTLTDIVLTSLNHWQQMVGIFHDILCNYSTMDLEEHVITGLSHIPQTENKNVHTSTQNLRKESSSSWEAVVSGVLQGLILRPLLSLIYKSDLPYGICYMLNL